MLKISEVAKQLNVSERTVRRLAEKGELPAVKIGCHWRIKPEDLEKYKQEKSNKKGE